PPGRVADPVADTFKHVLRNRAMTMRMVIAAAGPDEPDRDRPRETSRGRTKCETVRAVRESAVTARTVPQGTITGLSRVHRHESTYPDHRYRVGKPRGPEPRQRTGRSARSRRARPQRAGRGPRAGRRKGRRPVGHAPMAQESRAAFFPPRR